MDAKRFLALLALAVAGCDGPEPATGPSLDSPPGAARDNAESADEVALRSAAGAAGSAPRADASGAAPTVSTRFQLGTHYDRLSPTQPTSSGPTEVEVAELFWYGCPHCNAFESHLQAWLPRKAEYVSFVRIPAVWNPLVRLHARAFYTAEALGKIDEMHEAFFREIHVNGNSLDTEAKLAEFFAKFGIERDAFKDAFDSFAVHTKLQRADELARRYEIASVPSIVVNGKYTTDGTKAGGYEQLIELINELSATEHAAN
jgi:protein dithiol oxidoreductase (disulfide-forming)